MHQRFGHLNLAFVPEADVLLVERHIRARGVSACGTPCFGIEHQGQHALGFWLVRQQGDHEPAEPDGLFGKRGITVLADLRPPFGVGGVDRLEQLRSVTEAQRTERFDSRARAASCRIGDVSSVIPIADRGIRGAPTGQVKNMHRHCADDRPTARCNDDDSLGACVR